MKSEARNSPSTPISTVKRNAVLSIIVILLGLSLAAQADPLDTWQVRRQISSPASIVYGNGKFVVMPMQPYVTTQVLVSTNGTDWTAFLSPEFSALGKLAFGNGQFLAAFLRYGYPWTNGASIYSSMDGISWTWRAFQPYPSSIINPPRVSGGNGVYVSAAINLSVSTNLTDWTTVALDTGSFYDLIFANGRFMAPVGFSPAFLTSTDGLIWQYSPAPDARLFQSVGSANGRFAAFSPAASDGSQPAVSGISFDGITWSGTTLSDNFTNSTKLVSAGDKFFLLNTISNGFFASSDALAWQTHSFGTNIQITDVAFGANTFVAVGDSILQSGPVTNTVSAPELSIRMYPGVSITGAVGQHYLLEYSDDLLQTNNLQPLTNIFLTVSPSLWVDATATNSEHRFYRAVVLP